MCDKTSDTLAVAQWARGKELPAVIVGRWVWIEFPSKPDTETRESLKSAGFRWIRKRGRWAHNCGFPTRHAPYDPRIKYGSVPVSELDSIELV